MVVVPAAPHYQGQLHQDQLRFKAFEIAMRVLCQHHVYQFQTLNEVCKDLRSSSFQCLCVIMLDLQLPTNAFSWLVWVVQVLITTFEDVFLFKYPSGGGFGTLLL